MNVQATTTPVQSLINEDRLVEIIYRAVGKIIKPLIRTFDDVKATVSVEDFLHGVDLAIEQAISDLAHEDHTGVCNDSVENAE